MATRQLRAFEDKGNHHVGNLTRLKSALSLTVQNVLRILTTYAVELGFDAEGNRSASQLAACR